MVVSKVQMEAAQTKYSVTPIIVAAGVKWPVWEAAVQEANYSSEGGTYREGQCARTLGERDP